MVISLREIPAFTINLDRSHDRWVRFFQSASLIFTPENLRRVSGVDGRTFMTGDSWKPNVQARLQREGVLGLDGEHLLDPVRTALCLSHQRALHRFLEQETPTEWALIFEDDARPGEALAGLNQNLEIDVPDDFDLLFLHDRVWRRGAASSDCENWRIVRGGIGLEAYLVNIAGARKLLQAFTPVIEECDIQLMTFMEGFANLEQKQAIWDDLRSEGHTAFPAIRAYAPVRPYFQTDHWIPSVKFATIEEAEAGADIVSL